MASNRQKQIVVINPNSSETVTRDMDAALEPLRTHGRPGVNCVTLKDGPPAIESDADVADAANRVRRYVEDNVAAADAFVIACFSDPGVQEARALSSVPVFGIGECAILTALARGGRTGVISILESSRIRHADQFRRLGLEKRIAGDQSIDSGVAGLRDEAETLRRMTDAGMRLRDCCRADVLVLACAGMARYRSRLQSQLGIPVIDPTQAATGIALDALSFDGTAD